MIILIKGNIKYPLTLDPSVWIFDDRKIPFENFLSGKDDTKDCEKIYDSYEYKIKPPVQASLEKFKQAGPGSGSYVMPLKPFLERSEPAIESNNAILLAKNNTIMAELSMNELMESALLFAIDGKQISEDGPVHLYLSNNQTSVPIKGFSNIIIV